MAWTEVVIKLIVQRRNTKDVARAGQKQPILSNPNVLFVLFEEKKQ